MTNDHNEDPTVPGRRVPEEDATIPSKPRPDGSSSGSEERTVPAGDADAGSGGDAGSGERATKAGDHRTAAKANNKGPLIGQTIGGCRIDKMLGKGAMGAVYRARQLKLDRDVAVKVIRKEMMADARMLKRFEVEARTVGKFNSANVVMVHDVGFEPGVGDDEGVHYLVMEFIEGANLREHVKQLAGGRLPAGEALPLIRQACKGLEEARRLGIVHRDIKPDNLMLTEQGLLKIADFGIAKPIQDDFNMTMTSELIGTPLYMSPEQCQGGADIDFRSDMYSLGATFFYLLTGEPPIRASSVYELIQTKTKMENLCLWKALPELDENHPLSRVIERMTANDREDRYESYEELLNDLVLVEAGETIAAKAPKTRTRRKADEGAAGGGDGGGGGRSPLLLALLALVLVGGGGGGYWWWSQQQGGGSKTDVPVVKVGDNGGKTSDVDVGAELDDLRARLRKNGPAGLAKEFRQLVVPPALADDARQLAEDIAAASDVDKRCAALQQREPAGFELPFTDLDAWFRSADEAASPGRPLGSAASDWVESRRLEVRGTARLGAMAVSSLLAAWSTWQSDRQQVGGDEDARARLLGELQRIKEGRNRLLDLLGGQRATIERGLTAEQLQKAEAGLNEPVGPSVDANAAQKLKQYRKQFENDGPSKPLSDAVDAILPGPDDLQLKTAVVTAIAAGQRVKELVEQLDYPVTPRLPFTDVEDFHKRIELEIDKLAAAELPWVDKVRAAKRDDPRMRGLLVEACRAAFQKLRNDADANRPMRELEQQAARLQSGKDAARRIFPDEEMAKAIDEAAPLQDLDGAMAEGRAREKSEALGEKIDEINDRLLDVGTLADWAEKKAGLEGDIKRLREELAAVPQLTSLAKRLDRVAAGCKDWVDATDTMKQVSVAFRAAELKKCGDLLEVAMGGGRAGVTEFGNMQKIVESSRAAFDELETSLDIGKATVQIERAMRTLESTPGIPGEARNRLVAWKNGLKALDVARAGMVPIAAAGGIDAFFVASTECSVREFQAFVQDLQQNVQGASDAEKLASVRGRLEGAEMTAQLLADLLQMSPRGRDNQPIEKVRWHEAQAFCRWFGKSLPTEREWLLAAFGSSPRRSYSWGDEWSTNRDDRNPTYRKPADVADRGLSWRKADGVMLHHMSDNVAEWVAEVNGSSGRAVGGHCYRRAGATAQEHCRGEAAETPTLTERKSGVGFRPVLRPRDFPQLDWPR